MPFYCSWKSQGDLDNGQQYWLEPQNKTKTVQSLLSFIKNLVQILTIQIIFM